MFEVFVVCKVNPDRVTIIRQQMTLLIQFQLNNYKLFCVQSGIANSAKSGQLFLNPNLAKAEIRSTPPD